MERGEEGEGWEGKGREEGEGRISTAYVLDKDE